MPPARNKRKNKPVEDTATLVDKIMESQEALHGAKTKRQKKQVLTPPVSVEKSTEQTVQELKEQVQQLLAAQALKAPTQDTNPVVIDNNIPESSGYRPPHDEPHHMSDSDENMSDDEEGEHEGEDSDEEPELPMKNRFAALFKSSAKVPAGEPATPSPTESKGGMSDKLRAIMMKTFKRNENCGPKIDASLAEIIETSLSTFATKEEMTNLDELLRPENCPTLVTPIATEDLWGKALKHKAIRNREFGLQKVQKLIMQAMIPIIQLSDKSIKDDGILTPEETVQTMSEVLQTLSFAHTMVTYRRRQNIQPQLRYEYSQQLVSKANPPGPYLFGEDIQKKIKEMKEIESISKKFEKTQGKWQASKKGQKQGQNQSQSQSNSSQGYQNGNQWQGKKKSGGGGGYSGGGGGYKGKKPYKKSN